MTDLNSKTIPLVLMIGGNKGNVLNTFEQSKKELELELGVVSKTSSLYETEAWGDANQASFLNQALVFQTHKTPQEVLAICLKIEEQFGRVRDADNQWGNRTLDVDILYYGNEIIKTTNLIIPHLRIEFRKFVLIPLTEIIPNFQHPTLLKTQKGLLAICTDELAVKKR